MELGKDVFNVLHRCTPLQLHVTVCGTENWGLPRLHFRRSGQASTKFNRLKTIRSETGPVSVL